MHSNFAAPPRSCALKCCPPQSCALKSLPPQSCTFKYLPPSILRTQILPPSILCTQIFAPHPLKTPPPINNDCPINNWDGEQFYLLQQFTPMSIRTPSSFFLFNLPHPNLHTIILNINKNAIFR